MLGVTLVVFLVLRMTGDPVQLYLPPGASPEMVQQFRTDLGLDDPLPVQYFRFVKGLAAGDIGQSFYYNESAAKVIMERFPATLALTLGALLVTLLIGIPAGIAAAVFRDRKGDFAIRFFALLGQCVPVFWIGILLVILFAVKLHWLPTSGRGTLRHLILPAFSLGLYSAATTTRLLRSAMLETLGKEYITVARAKGLGKAAVVLKHALRNSVSSVLTVLGMQVAGLLGGAIITETVFAWPGVGRLAIQSINNRDFTVVEGVVVLVAVAYVAISFLVDVLYAVINPRVKLTKGA